LFVLNKNSSLGTFLPYPFQAQTATDIICRINCNHAKKPGHSFFEYPGAAYPLQANPYAQHIQYNTGFSVPSTITASGKRKSPFLTNRGQTLWEYYRLAFLKSVWYIITTATKEVIPVKN